MKTISLALSTAAVFGLASVAFASPTPLEESHTDSDLVGRAVTRCTTSANCASNTVPYASKPYCAAGTCSFICNSGWVKSGSKCYVNTKTATTTTRRTTTTTSRRTTTTTTRAPTATGKTCSASSDCAGTTVPYGSKPYCALNKCSFICNAGYEKIGDKCYIDADYAPPTTRTTTTAAPAATDNFVNALLVTKGIKAFKATTKGVNAGAIFSWFRTDSTQDFTNGQSWCLLPYRDNSPGFAPSLAQMLADSGGDYNTATAKYCGLEIEATTTDGRTATLYLMDAFDDTWVRTPTSLDIVKGSFAKLFGRETDDKNDVAYGSWKFTGRRNTRYAFRGPG